MMLNYLKNGTEILLLTTFFYWFSLWLKKDKKKNLVWYFYSYCLLLFGCELTGLSVVFSFMLYAAPLLFVTLIIIHEDLLQRNFICMQKNTEKISHDTNVLDEIVRAALYAFNKNKNFLVILENRFDIESFIKTDYPLNADLQQASLMVLIESSFFNENTYLWCSTSGKIKAINASWNIQNHVAESDQADKKNQWKHDALLITSKADTVIIRGDAQTRLFDLVTAGKIQEKISAAQLLPLIRVHGSSKFGLKGDKEYEKRTQTFYQQQQNS